MAVHLSMSQPIFNDYAQSWIACRIFSLRAAPESFDHLLYILDVDHRVKEQNDRVAAVGMKRDQKADHRYPEITPASAASLKRLTLGCPLSASAMIRFAKTSRTISGCPVSCSSLQAESKA
jgi:hypothetical protein